MASQISATHSAAPQSKSEIAFIDRGIDDVATLLAGLRADVEPILLSNDEPAPRQMARAVQRREGLEAIHIIAHGRQGEVSFSAGALSFETASASAIDLAAIGRPLNKKGKLLLWSCNTGAGEKGSCFTEVLAHAIDSKVVGATGLIGSSTRGANWRLDCPDALPPLTKIGIANYAGLMANTITLDLNGIATGTAGTTGFTEQTPALLFPSATVVTTGSVSCNSVKLSLGSFTATETLSLDSTGAAAASAAGVTLSYVNGVLTLTHTGGGGNPSDTTWNSILDHIQYNNTSDAPAGPTRTITVVASDSGGSHTSTATDTINVTQVDDPPKVTDTGGTTAWMEASGTGANSAVVVDSGVTVTDVDNTSLASAKVSITGGFQSGQDVLAFTNQNGITGSYNSSTGILTLSGTATVAQYQAALDSVTYNNTSHNPNTANRTISFVTNDGTLNSAASTKTVSVGAVDTAPTNSVPASQTDHWDLTGNVVFSSGNGNQILVSDVDNASLTVTISVGHGTLNLSDITGLSFSSGSNGASSMTFTGMQTDINTALNGLTYHTTSTDMQVGDVNDTLVLQTSDGTLSANSSVNIDVICFMPGTMVRTPDGEVAVETIKHGDLVLTQDGRTKPVSWLGRQTVSTVFADKLRVLPIRIKTGALADNVPQRDLLISPDHAVLINGALIQAGALVNGTSIVRETQVPPVFTYYHVEVDDHSLILAENTPAETFVDNIERLAFDNWAEHEALYPEGKSINELPYPRAKAHRQVPVNIRVMLAERAQLIGAVADTAIVA